jgi:hypothetical protein
MRNQRDFLHNFVFRVLYYFLPHFRAEVFHQCLKGFKTTAFQNLSLVRFSRFRTLAYWIFGTSSPLAYITTSRLIFGLFSGWSLSSVPENVSEP